MSDALPREWYDAAATLVRYRPGLSTAEVARELDVEDVERLAEELWRCGRGLGIGQHADRTWWHDKDSATVRARRAVTGGVVTIRPPHLDASDDEVRDLETWDWPLTVFGEPHPGATGHGGDRPS